MRSRTARSRCAVILASEAAAGIKRLVDNSARPLDVDALEAILDAAWHGDPGRLSSEGVEVSA